MTIIPPLPFTMVNGATADGSQVMADLNQIRDSVNANAQSTGSPIAYQGCVVRQSVSQNMSIPLPPENLASRTVLQFQIEDVDTGGIHSPSVNPSRLTVPAGASKIKINARVSALWVNDGTINITYVVSLKKNGVAVVPSISGFTTKSNPPTISTDGQLAAHPSGLPNDYIIFNIATPCLLVTPGDYFEVVLTGPVNSTATVAADTYFEMQILQ